MFWKIGFFVLLAVVILFTGMFMKSNPMNQEGSASWIEFYSDTPDQAIKFLSDVFNIKVVENKTAATGVDYKVLKADGAMWPFAGIMNLPEQDGKKVASQTMIYLTVKNYENAHNRMIANGAVANVHGKVAGGMKFGVYVIPGGLTVGISQYGVK